MSQIEIQILKQGSETTKVISCSFFTMKDAYRAVNKYRNSLLHFLDNVSRKRPEFCVRVYTDDSGKDECIRIAKKFSNVSVYHFNLPELREEVGHIGTFGTFPRFLPLFEKGLDIVWVCDIDIPEHWLEKVPTSEFNYKTNICYDRKVYGRKYTILAGTVLSRITFPKQLITRFINRLVKGDFAEIVSKLNDGKKPDSKVPYGIDEVFMNTSIYNYLASRDIKVQVTKNFLQGLDTFIVHSKKLSWGEGDTLRLYYMFQHEKNFDKVKKIIEKHIDWAVSQRECFRETLDLLPSFKTSFEKVYVLKGSELT
jgi:hypothetical protein